jgi:hypothetical protein
MSTLNTVHRSASLGTALEHLSHSATIIEWMRSNRELRIQPAQLHDGRVVFSVINTKSDSDGFFPVFPSIDTLIEHAHSELTEVV